MRTTPLTIDELIAAARWTATVLASEALRNEPDAPTLEALRFLALHTPDLNALNSKGIGALHMLATHCYAPDVVNLLVKSGANPNLTTAGGGFPLLLAAASDHAKHIVNLIENGANVNQSTQPEGYTALMTAALIGGAESVRALAENGAELAQMTTAGQTALMLVSSAGSVEMIKLLVELGADLHQLNERGQNALAYATNANRPRAILTLVKLGAKPAIGGFEFAADIPSGLTN